MEANSDSSWTFLTNHAHVLVSLAINSDQPLRNVAKQVGITERAVQRIVTDLENGGYLERVREGRRNQYVLHLKKPLRHPIEAHVQLENLFSPLIEDASSEKNSH